MDISYELEFEGSEWSTPEYDLEFLPATETAGTYHLSVDPISRKLILYPDRGYRLKIIQ